MQAPQIGEVERAYPPLAIQADAQYLLSLTNAGGSLVGFPGSHEIRAAPRHPPHPAELSVARI